MLAIITPVSLADQRLDSFTTNQEQLAIISWPVWLRPTTALVGGAQPMAAGGGRGALRHGLHPLALALLHSSRWQARRGSLTPSPR